MKEGIINPIHLHEYQRSVSSIEIYRCMHPDCNHYTRREFIVGKRALCHKCKQPFIMTQKQLKAGQKVRGILHPTCIFCSKSKKAKTLTNIEEILEKEVFSSSNIEENKENKNI